MAGTDFTTTITGTVTGFDVSPITNMNNALRSVPPAAASASQAGSSLSTSLNQVGTTTKATGATFQGTGALAGAFGGTLVKTSGNAQQLVGAHSALGSSFAPVQGGLSTVNTLLPTYGTNLGTTAAKSQQTEQSSISLGEKIGLMAGFITTTIGSIGGLIEGFTGLEAAQVAADRAQQRVNTSALAAQKAQDQYNIQVQKFGPSSRQATEALTNFNNKTEAARIAEERASVTQNRLNESYLNFGLEVITVGGELAQMGSTVSILVGKLGGHAAAAALSAEASTAEGVAAGEAAIGLNAEGAAAAKSAEGTDVARASTLGLGAEFVAIAAPIVAAVALIALIETNTFGMGDAFRTVTPQIGSAIDAIVNGVALLYNGFIKLAEGIVEWYGNFNNSLINAYNAWQKFLDSIVVGATNLGVDIQNAVSKIPNFFIDNLINPVIAAWNTFVKSLVTAWQTAVNTIADFFKPAATAIIASLKTIVDAGAALPGVLGDPFRQAKPAIDAAEVSLKNVGSTGATSGKQIADGIGQIKPVADIQTTALEHIATSGLFPLSNAYVDVTGTLQALDGAMIQNAGNIKTGATEFLNYASKGENVANVIKGQVVPGIASILAPVQGAITGMLGLGAASGKTADATTKQAAATKLATAAHKDYATQLTATIAKENDEASAMLKSVASGQQVSRTLADLNKAYAESVTKLSAVATKLTDTTAIQLRHNTALTEGVAKAGEFILKLQDEATSTQAYNTALDQATGFTAKFGTALPATTTNLENLAKAMAGDQQAADAFVKAFDEATKRISDDGQKMVDDIAGKIDTLGKTVKENKVLKELPKDVLKALTPDQKDFAVQLAIWDKFGQDVAGGLNIAFQQAGGQFNADGIEAADQYIQGLGKLKGVQNSPELQNFLSGMHSTFQQAAEIGGQGGEQLIVQFLAKMEQQGGSSANLAKTIADNLGLTELVNTARAQGAAAGTALSGGVASGTGAVPPALQKNVIDPFTGLPSTAQAVGQKVGQAFIDIGNALAGLPAEMASLFARAFVDSILTPLAANVTAIRGWLTGIQGIVNTGIPPLFTKSFNTAVQNAAGSLNQISTYMKGTWLSAVEAPIKAFVTFANQQFATIRPPPLPTQTGPITSVTPTGPVAPIKIPAPDLTAFNAGLATMKANAAAAFVAIQQQAATAFANIITASASIAVGLNAAFSRGAQDAGGQLKLLTTTVQTDITNMSTAINAIAIVFNTAFVKGANDAAGSVNLLATTVQTDMTNMAAAINAIAISLNTAFNTGAQDAAGIMNQLVVSIQTNITAIAAAINTIPVTMTTAFNTGAQNAAGVMNELAKNVQTNIQNMIAATNAFAIAITTNFNKGAQNAAGEMNALAKNEEGNIANMIAATNAFAVAITHNFGQGASNAAGSMNSLASNVATNVNTMISRLNNVISEFNSIRSSIQSAQSAVQSLINSINNIPTNKTVNVNVIEHITQQVRQVIVPASIGASVANAAISGNTPATLTTNRTTTTTTAGLTPAARPRIIRLEISEPTIVKINEREFLKQINKKLLELDIGALA
jgi:hypothetical protein